MICGNSLIFQPLTIVVYQVLERHSDSGYMVGLEYVVEVRPVREGEPWYSCTLCDQEFRYVASLMQHKQLHCFYISTLLTIPLSRIKPGEETSSKRRLTRHLGLMSHKLNFLQKHFPRWSTLVAFQLYHFSSGLRG